MFNIFLLAVAGISVLLNIVMAIHLARRGSHDGDKEHPVDHSNASADSGLSFIGMVSHELRGPLQILSANVERLENADHAAVEQMLPLMRSAISQLLRISSDLLVVVKGETGNFQVNLGKVNTADLRNGIVHAAEVMNIKGIPFRLEYLSSVPDIITTDRDRLMQILTNVLNNAFKYTDTGSVSLVVDAPEASCLRLTISDTGVGIPQAELNDVTRPFFRSSITSRSTSGTGLGLPVVKELLDSLGGRFEISSQPHKGTVVEIRIPLTE